MKAFPSDVVALLEKEYPSIFPPLDQEEKGGRINLSSPLPKELPAAIAGKAQFTETVLAATSGKLATLIQLIDTIDERLLPSNREDRLRYTVAVTSIRTALNAWAPTDARSGVAIGNMASDGNINPMFCIWMTLRGCPDRPIGQAASTHLQFISDVVLREDLLRDVEEIELDLAAGNWKGATVLAGAAMEAILLDRLKALQQQELENGAQTAYPNSHQTLLAKTLDKWDLEHILKVAKACSLFKRPETHQLCELAQGFRNLIHPGKAIRTAQRCDKGTAYSTAGALFRLIAENE